MERRKRKRVSQKHQGNGESDLQDPVSIDQRLAKVEDTYLNESSLPEGEMFY